ncbi:hypothetical protein AB0C42_33640 [Micromonospora taraxaci]|uniref:hypothetical protein n=1 Tax=Micromonospora taraxaci TaxID=1316803 RepID=UPI0033F4BC86
MMGWSREQLGEAIGWMVHRYGEAQRHFARHPLTSPEGRLAGRAVRRRAAAIERLTLALIHAPQHRPGHPVWCSPSLCVDGVHRGEPVQIHAGGLVAALRQGPDPRHPVFVALEFWEDPEAAEPTELILLRADTDAPLLSDTLTRFSDLVRGDQS